MKDKDLKVDDLENDDLVLPDDAELMDDLGLGLKTSLDAAFDMSGIKVSEELIAATLKRIEALEKEEQKEETPKEEAPQEEILKKDTTKEQVQREEILKEKAPQEEISKKEENKEELQKKTSQKADDTESGKIVNLADRRAKIRGLMKIVVPVAAALIIGLFGINIVRNGMLKKESAATNNVQMDSGAAKTASAENGATFATGNDMNTADWAEEAPEKTKSDNWTFGESNDTQESLTSEISVADNLIQSGNGVDFNAASEDDIDGATEFQDPQKTTAGEAKKETSDKAGIPAARDEVSDDMTEGSFAEYSFVIPEENAEKVAEILAKYPALSVSAQAYDAGTDADGIGIAKYLVIRNGAFYFTNNESMEPDESGAVYYFTEDPDIMSDSLAAEIEEILGE
ncbi:MAG: hypothetical protein K6E85_12265 [Lachnospiraceae bacterium]|nr:hypothetical protein [Lachnospiraceae bacterium]